jgi:hypothetical protein
MILTFFVIWFLIGGTVALELRRNGTFDLIDSLKDSHPDIPEIKEFFGEDFPKVLEAAFFVAVVLTFPLWLRYV